MLRVPQILDHSLSETNQVQKSYRIRYRETEGYLLLSQNKIRIIEESSGNYSNTLELYYEYLAAISSRTRHILKIVDKKGQTYIIVTHGDATAYLIEEDLKSRIAPLDYHRHG